MFGIGQPVEGIDLARFVAWANTCEANGWAVSGTIYEPGDRWANIKEIMQAGCGEPVVTGGVLSVRYRAPQVSLATITEDDIADDDFSITAMQPYRDRVNGIQPKYRSPDHNWEFVTAGKVSVSTYVTEDGEEKVEERQFNLVRDVNQAAQLAAYALMDARELGPIELTLKPQWRWLKPGECVTLDLPSFDSVLDGIILSREIDPATMKVKLTLIGETGSKHAYALGLTGTPPPTPALGQTAEERDEIAANAGAPYGYERTQILTSSQTLVTITGTDTTVTISDHDRVYPDKEVAVTGATITGLTPSTGYWLYYDDEDRAGGAVTWNVTTDFFTAQNTPDTPYRHYGGFATTDVTGGTGTTGGGSLPPGAGGGSPYPNYVEP